MPQEVGIGSTGVLRPALLARLNGNVNRDRIQRFVTEEAVLVVTKVTRGSGKLEGKTFYEVRPKDRPRETTIPICSDFFENQGAGREEGPATTRRVLKTPQQPAHA